MRAFGEILEFEWRFVGKGDEKKEKNMGRRRKMSEEQNKEKYSFRIIAVRVLANCDSRIRRALKEDTTYFLCNDYDDCYGEDGKWKSIQKADNSENLPDNFFAIPQPENKKKQQTPTVNVSAIVGKNGDGKSSLVELMLRIINNFGVAYGFREDQESLTMVEGLSAILYYEIDGKLYNILSDGNNVEASFEKEVGKEKLKRHQKQLFYTLVANYSIYAYNSRHFKHEVEEDDDCWINGVFHKNDSYQTPLVLNPMRTEGNFDINREESLCRQRLMALYADLGDVPDARIINENKIATGFAFNLEEQSKLEIHTLKGYFRKTWKSTTLNGFTTQLSEQLREHKKSKTPPLKGLVWLGYQAQENFWIKYAELWKKYEALFHLATNVLIQIYKENQADYEEGTSDVRKYLETAKEAIEYFEENIDIRQKAIDSLEQVKEICGNLTGQQLQRIVLIIDICELWSRHHWFKKRLFATAIKQYVNGQDGRSKEHREAYLYIIYKTINVFTQYKRFRDVIDLEDRNFYLFGQQLDENSSYDRGLKECFELLFIDEKRNHIVKLYDTLKLRQTINFLVYQSFKQTGTEDGYTKRDFGLGHFVTFDKLQSYIQKAKKKCDEETIALLPPPIFIGDILIREGADRPGNPRFRMSDLSSGELQMINSINTYIYHLRNLNYHVATTKSLEYYYVNLVLEEVELYFHPEYQRKYVYQMLRQIEQVRLNNILAINIILVTHSPFVLTDIPKNNVLFLEEGKPVRIMQENTFGANIHSLLQNGFFLEGAPMGEFAKKKINKMFERLHNGEYGEDLYEEIRLVSEPLLKTQLIQLYSLNKLPHHNPLYEELLKRVKILEEKLNG